MPVRKDLTNAAIEAAKPRAERYEIPDAHTRGLVLTVYPTGSKAFHVRGRVNGRAVKPKVGDWPGMPLKEARPKAASMRQQMADGESPTEAKRAKRAAALARKRADNDRVERAVEEFVSVYGGRNLKPNVQTEAARMLRKELAPWFGRLLSEIEPRDVHRLYDKIIARGAPVTANRLHAWLGLMFRWARERQIVSSNPIDGIRAPTKEKSRDRVLSDAELRLVMLGAERLGFPGAQIVKMLTLTAARRTEVTAAAWAEFDLDAGAWTIPASRTKNARPHTIPLSPAAVKLLRSVPRIEGGAYVFSPTARPFTAYDKLKKKLDAAIAEVAAEEGAEMPAPFTFHDLRRTIATNLQRLGVRLEVTEAVLNHVSGSRRGVIGIYQRHDWRDEKRAALDAWARYLDAIVTGEPAGNVVELAIARG